MKLREHRTGWTYHRPASATTAQEKWDDQIRLNREGVYASRRWIPLLRRLGLNRWADRIYRDTRATLAIADRMEACPNNPRNGGDGYDHRDALTRELEESQRCATWHERRTEYVSQSKHLVIRYPLGNPHAGWRVELLDDTPQAYAALRQLRDDFGQDYSITVVLLASRVSEPDTDHQES
jgi:hypothetical protein